MGSEMCIRDRKDICANYFILDSIFYRAVDLFRKKGKSSREAAAYSLYKAFVNSEVPRTLKEVSTMFNIPVSKIAQEESNCVSSLSSPSVVPV